MKVMVPLAQGFEEIEAMTIVDVLRRAGIKVDTVGVISSVIEGSHGIRIMVDKTLLNINPDDYDAIAIPGGSIGCKNLEMSLKIIEILKDFKEKDKVIAAICAAPLILAKHGLLDDKKATVYPGFERQLPYPRGDKVVVDGNMITSQAPGTAIEFAIEIVRKLTDDHQAQILKRQLVV